GCRDRTVGGPFSTADLWEDGRDERKKGMTPEKQELDWTYTTFRFLSQVKDYRPMGTHRPLCPLEPHLVWRPRSLPDLFKHELISRWRARRARRVRPGGGPPGSPSGAGPPPGRRPSPLPWARAWAGSGGRWAGPWTIPPYQPMKSSGAAETRFELNGPS